MPTLSNQVHPYSTFLTDKGRAPARSAAARSDDRVGCSASDGRCAPARPVLHVSTRLLPFLPHALASADCIRPFQWSPINKRVRHRPVGQDRLEAYAILRRRVPPRPRNIPNRPYLCATPQPRSLALLLELRAFLVLILQPLAEFFEDRLADLDQAKLDPIQVLVKPELEDFVDRDVAKIRQKLTGKSLRSTLY